MVNPAAWKAAAARNGYTGSSPVTSAKNVQALLELTATW